MRVQHGCRLLQQAGTLCLVTISVLFLGLGSGNVVASEAVSLQQVLEDITKTDPAILEAMKQYESVVAERSIASSEYYPTIGTELSAGPERTEGVPTDDEEVNLVSTSATLYARQNLFNGGRTGAFVDETDARITSAAYEVLNVANNKYLEIAEGYINVVKARELLKIAEKNSLTQERIMRQVREKTDAGFNRVSELYNSESRLVLSKGNFISRQQDLNQALVKFHKLFGRNLEPSQFVEPSPDYQIPGSLAENVDVAFKEHPAIKVAKYNIEKTKYSYKKSAAAYYPTVDLELQGQYREDIGGEEGDTTQSGAYLTLNYTFFDGGLRKGAKLRDQQTIRKEYQRSYIERRNLNETVRLAWNIMEAEQQKNDYLAEHVELSAKTLGAFKEEYYVGRRTLLDLLNMENEYTDAELSLAQSHFSYLTSLYQIMQATGVLLSEHDTGIRDMLVLPEEEDDEAMYEEDEYKDHDLDASRDKDVVLDTVDQCDNSITGITVSEHGCEKDDVSTVGYPHEEGWQLSPYIAPNDYSQPIKEEDLKTDVKAETMVGKLILEVNPDSRLLTREAKRQLLDFVESVVIQSEVSVLVEGYTASDNESEENTRLSQQRAELVKGLMVEQGLDEARITAVGRGIENPRASNSTRSGRTMNRRVEITVSSK